MTVKECYDKMGGSYEEVAGRLRTDERIQRFLLKVLDDKSFELLHSSLAEKNIEEAFRAAHTLKGVSQNLAITPLYHISSELSDVLRNRHDYGADIDPVAARLEQVYEQCMECIRELKG